MSGRHGNVRCDNCVFWKETNRMVDGSEEAVGDCRIRAPTESYPEGENCFASGKWVETDERNWCGEFRETWPDPDDVADSKLARAMLRKWAETRLPAVPGKGLFDPADDHEECDQCYVLVDGSRICMAPKPTAEEEAQDP